MVLSASLSAEELLTLVFLDFHQMAGLLGVDFLGMGSVFLDVDFFQIGFIFGRHDSGKGKN